MRKPRAFQLGEPGAGHFYRVVSGVAGREILFGDEQPAPPEGSATAHFSAAFMPTGYKTFVKILELAGGILVAIPMTLNFGLLVVGPIIVNILAFHIFITKWVGMGNPMLIAIVVLALYLLWCGRRAFRRLANKA